MAVTEKDAARLLVREALSALRYGEKEFFVRINSLESGLGLMDLEAMVPTGRVGIRLPKTESAGEVLACEREILRLEKAGGLPPGSTPMMAAVESARGVLHAEEIAHASKRLVGIALGAEDYVTDLKTTRSPSGIELLFGRSMVLLAARSAGIDAIDTVYSDVNDEEGFREEVRLIRQLGFSGKSIINPRQIAVVHEVFTPGMKEVEDALEIIEAIREAEERGTGVLSLHGKMVDRPIVERARWVVGLAVAAGTLQRKEESQYG